MRLTLVLLFAVLSCAPQESASPVESPRLYVTRTVSLEESLYRALESGQDIGPCGYAALRCLADVRKPERVCKACLSACAEAGTWPTTGVGGEMCLETK